jgi:cation:H+ antiporter
VIGSTIVAFGTSMPEFTVNMNSAIGGETGLALGNILGSNLFNICAIVGIVCLFKPITVASSSADKDLPMCLIAALLMGVCGNQALIDGLDQHALYATTGIAFLCFFMIFMKYVYGEASASTSHHHQAKSSGIKNPDDPTPHAVGRSIAFIVLGLAGLVFGGEFIVDGATGVATAAGLSPRVIGLVIVGPGTSFPELIASIVAARQGQTDMVMGNVLGSNIFNIFFTLGATTLVKPVPLDLDLNTGIVFNIAVTAALAVYVMMSRSKRLGRPVGAVLLAAYVGYLVLSIRG